MACPLEDDHSDLSSELGCLSRTPTPPIYPSPPSSHQSSTGSPGPEMSFTSAEGSQDGDGGPPAKRRRVSQRAPRDTRHIDMSSLDEGLELRQSPDLERLLIALKRKRKIVVVAGAGMSVSAGIPDFRSSTGLFKTLKTEHNLKGSGKHLFDASVYRDADSTNSFHQMVRTMSHQTRAAKPTAFHHLVARLASEGRLLRLYTQNVDGIDTSLQPLATKVPLPRKGPWPKTVQLHGGLEKMVCTKCGSLSGFDAKLFDGPIPPECDHCRAMDLVRTEVAGKRSHGVGRLRPRMVLYNEFNPDEEAIGAVSHADLRARPDAIIVVGTTLKIPGVRRIVQEMCRVVRDRRDGLAVWINNEPEPAGKDFEWDLVVKGTCDEIAELAALRRWDDDDVGPVTSVTDEEMKHLRKQAQPQVIIHSTESNTMPTPINSPRPEHFRDLSEPRRPSPEPLTPYKRKLSTSARPIFPILLKQQQNRVNTLARDSAHVAAAPVAIARKPKAPVAAGKGVGTRKPVSKSASASKRTVAKAKAIAAPSRKINAMLPNSKSTGNQPAKALGKSPGKTRPQPMAPLSPLAARNNTSSPHAPPVRSLKLSL